MKKILSIALVVVLLAGIAVSGTMAYLQDSDSDVNVMTLGNVQIEQIEQERDADGKLVTFKQAKPAYPAVGPIEWAGEGVDVNGIKYKVFTDELKNVVDKIVTVKNTGKSDAYVRTIVAIEAPDYDRNNLIHVNFNGDLDKTSWTPVDIDGVQYVYSVFTYNDALNPNEISAPSLMQLFLDSKATNEDVAKFGDTWEVLVLSQAVQTAGFADANNNGTAADEALDTAFGEANATNAAAWFAGDEFTAPTAVATADELIAALEAGESVYLTADITLDEAVIVEKDADINLNGHTLTTVGLNLTKGADIENGTITSGGHTNLIPHLKVSGGTLTMDNVTVDVQHHLNANANWSEASGMEVAGATAVLNNCHIKIHNSTGAQWVYSYGLSLNGATATMNGGSITATCVAGTAANGPTNPNAISTMGECTATLNNVAVSAGYYGTTVNGHFTLNTTDKAITSANIVDNRGGSHTINYID